MLLSVVSCRSPSRRTYASTTWRVSASASGSLPCRRTRSARLPAAPSVSGWSGPSTRVRIASTARVNGSDCSRRPAFWSRMASVCMVSSVPGCCGARASAACARACRAGTPAASVTSPRASSMCARLLLRAQRVGVVGAAARVRGLPRPGCRMQELAPAARWSRSKTAQRERRPATASVSGCSAPSTRSRPSQARRWSASASGWWAEHLLGARQHEDGGQRVGMVGAEGPSHGSPRAAVTCSAACSVEAERLGRARGDGVPHGRPRPRAGPRSPAGCRAPRAPPPPRP